MENTIDYRGYKIDIEFKSSKYYYDISEKLYGKDKYKVVDSGNEYFRGTAVIKAKDKVDELLNKRKGKVV